MSSHFKGELCDGHVHMTAKEYVDHKTREYHETQRMKLKKLSRNPALSEDVREMLDTQVYMINLLEWYREQYTELQKKYEDLRWGKNESSNKA